MMYQAFVVDEMALTNLQMLSLMATNQSSIKKNQQLNGGNANREEKYTCDYDNAHLEDLLRRAQIPVHEFNCNEIPKYTTVQHVYGHKPRINGLEFCKDLQRKGMIPRVAGLYNTGTNALVKQFQMRWEPFLIETNRTNGNLPQSKSAMNTQRFFQSNYFRWDVPWGKHVPATYHGNVTVPPSNPTLPDIVVPIIMVRDPFTWITSMCRSPYGAKWKHGSCANQSILGISQSEANSESTTKNAEPVTTKFWFGKQSSMPVRFSVTYPSLVHLWNTFLNQYLQTMSHPVIIIRLEDIILHGDKVLVSLEECFWGRRLTTEYDPIHSSSKSHGSGSAYATVLKSVLQGAVPRIHADDSLYLRTNLDPRLMKLLHYNHGVW